MEKNYDFKPAEKTWYDFWQQNGLFTATPASDKKSYSLLMPPPNLNGELHLGHAMQHSIMDAIARFKRMQGHDVLLLPGVDHAGIQFEGTFNKRLEKQGLSKHKLGREKWLEMAWEFKDQIYKSFHNTWTVMGISADWSREVFTLEPKVQKAVLTAFQNFWEQDLLYKGAYIVQWCPKCGTAIEDVEMEYQERAEKLYFIKYPIEGENDHITIATARPETISADVAIAVFPKHPKYAQFLGKRAINPFTDTRVEIIEDARVDKAFGTGALKITPGHDLLDYAIGKDHNLPILHAISKDGKITPLDNDLSGLKVQEARIKAYEKLDKMGFIDHIEEYIHSVPICERCKTTVEPLISEEWFIKTQPLAQKALKNIDKINFVPKNYQQILANWYEHIHDWSISRSLWWGHRIPVWYCDKCNPQHQAGRDKDMVISTNEPGQSCQTCGEKHWTQDEQVLDTWFSSGLWPLATLGWPASRGEPDETPERTKYFPWSFELSSGEIKYLWISRMIMLSLHFSGQIPFENMFFHGMIRDLQGRKFSKSLGNGIDPNELRNQWGTDATRMALYSYSAPGRDSRSSKQVMDERCKNYRNFSTKLWNIAKFIIDSKPEDSAAKIDTTHPDDKQILEALSKTIAGTTKNIEQFQLHLATEQLYEFIWHEFADIYLEKSKARKAEAQPTLEYVFNSCLRLLHPFMPFITEQLWQTMPHQEKSIMLAPWPEAEIK